jgi:Spy/CpxP family protein refolding chaperone
MTRKAYLYFVLTFLCGVIAGSAGLYICLWHSGRLARRFGPPAPQSIVDRISRDLNMTADQKQQLTGIINDSFQKHRALDQQVGEQYRALRAETRDRIRKILNPEQQQKFDEMVRRFEQRRLQGPPGPPGPPR